MAEHHWIPEGSRCDAQFFMWSCSLFPVLHRTRWTHLFTVIQSANFDIADSSSIPVFVCFFILLSLPSRASVCNCSSQEWLVNYYTHHQPYIPHTHMGASFFCLSFGLPLIFLPDARKWTTWFEVANFSDFSNLRLRKASSWLPPAVSYGLANMPLQVEWQTLNIEYVT